MDKESSHECVFERRRHYILGKHDTKMATVGIEPTTVALFA